MTWANPAALWLGLLAIPVVLLHVLRPRRERLEVSSTFLWAAAPSPVSAATPWQRLRPSWLLLLQLLLVALLALAAAGPRRLTETPLQAHTVFIVDTSGSMAARDGDPDRLADAVAAAKRLRSELPDEGAASLVAAGPRARVLVSASSDAGAFADALDQLETSAGGADFADAFLLAESLETPGTPIGFVLVSDGGLSEAEQRLLPPGTTYEAIGRRSTNRAITTVTAEPQGSGLRSLATVENSGAERVRQTARVDLDGVTQVVEELVLGPGESITLDAELPAGDRVDVFLEGEDLLDADDHGYAVAASRRELTVLMVGPDDPFLERALATVPGLTVERSLTGSELTDDDGQPIATAPWDLIIFDQVAVPDRVPAPFLAIAPPSGPLVVTGEAELPAVTLVDTAAPLLSDLDLSDVVIQRSQVVDPGPGRVLVAGPGVPLLVTASGGPTVNAEGETIPGVGRPFAYLTFAPADSNLPLKVAFPVLIDRLIGELAGAELPPTGIVVGDRLPVPSGVAATVTSPAGIELDVPAGTTAPLADRTGFWEIDLGATAAPITIAVNADPAESNVDPVPGLPTELETIAPGEQRPRGQRSMLPWIALPALAVLAAEFWRARRRVGVSRGQWRAAVALRGLVALALVGALIGLTIDRTAPSMATVFLVDGSDSVATGGKADAVAWVQDALTGQADDDRSAVVLFGADARLELSLQQDNRLGTPAVVIDGSQTDLERALRLGAAVLPADARRRVVLLSDGRATTGDAETEAALVGESGAQIDVVPVGRAAGNDVAVAGLDLPGLVREGEAVEIEATLVAATSAESLSAVVTLLEDGEPVDEQVVELANGTNTVRFERTAEAGGLTRYQVLVAAAGDTITQNDASFGAVQVEGPARVLLVEGASGNSATLASALEAGGLLVDQTAVTVLPPADELATYSAIVLVDVDRRSLSTEQVELLASVTRDLGRGLVAIGGDRSFGLGGYLDTDLEEVLPVWSEIKDPKRRQTVAEVLAIDTSGSMGNCHCDEGAVPGISGMREDGGVNKTDISRSGAARAIDALSEQDEVGVLAFNTQEDWVIDLQQLPSEDVVSSGLRELFPSGGTNAAGSLATAADALRDSQAALKHIILFTDGFTSVGVLSGLASEAAALAAEGITVSVVATGEGAATELEAIATAGQGRFYPGRDLQQVPEIIMEEAVIASRDFVTEGEFFPAIASTSPVVEDLTESPPLLGFLGTTAKPTAETLLRIGPDQDPLLATWQVGLGRATAWTSDASNRWSQQWTSWDGYVDFWTRVVKDTFPAGDTAGAVRASVENGTLSVEIDGAEPFGEDATATAMVRSPDGESFEVPLRRTGTASFSGEAATDGVGSFAIGAGVSVDGETVLGATTIASAPFGREYLPGDPQPETLNAISLASGGRGTIQPQQAFEREGLDAGSAPFRLAPWLLLTAALLWPVAVALSRLSLTGTAPAARRVVDRVRRSTPSRPDREPVERGTEVVSDPGPTASAPRRRSRAPAEQMPPPTIGRLLDRKRTFRGETDAAPSDDEGGPTPTDGGG